jgi:hypothetical protein
MKRTLLLICASCGIEAEIALHAVREHFNICINYASDHEQAKCEAKAFGP